MKRLILLAALAAALIAPAAASAHPLGNFTINHYDRIDVSDGGIEVFSVLDMAEIPTFRERQQIDANGDAVVDDAEAATYATSKADEVRGNLTLTVNDGIGSWRMPQARATTVLESTPPDR